MKTYLEAGTGKQTLRMFLPQDIAAYRRPLRLEYMVQLDPA